MSICPPITTDFPNVFHFPASLWLTKLQIFLANTHTNIFYILNTDQNFQLLSENDEAFFSQKETEFIFYSLDKLKPKTKTKNQNIVCWCIWNSDYFFIQFEKGGRENKFFRKGKKVEMSTTTKNLSNFVPPFENSITRVAIVPGVHDPKVHEFYDNICSLNCFVLVKKFMEI